MSWFMNKEQRDFNKQLKVTVERLVARSKKQNEQIAALTEALKLLGNAVSELSTVKDDMAKVVKTVEGVVVENTNLKDSEKQIIKGFNKAMDDILQTGNL